MRDFFYNKGDVLIAILIIAVAIVVIYFRVGVVMGDSDPGERLKNLFSPIVAFITGGGADEDAEAEAPQVTEPDPEQPADTTVQEPPADTTTQEPPVTETPQAQEESPTEQQPETGAAVRISVVAGDAASTIADKLLTAGAITDKQAFLAEVDAQGAASRLKQGEFTIPAGSSIKDIVAILTA